MVELVDSLFEENEAGNDSDVDIKPIIPVGAIFPQNKPEVIVISNSNSGSDSDSPSER